MYTLGYPSRNTVLCKTPTPNSDPQANSVKLECSAPFSNECSLLKKLCSSPMFSRAELPV